MELYELLNDKDTPLVIDTCQVHKRACFSYFTNANGITASWIIHIKKECDAFKQFLFFPCFIPNEAKLWFYWCHIERADIDKSAGIWVIFLATLVGSYS